MTGFSHALIGASSAATITNILECSVEESIILIGIATFGALLPDIDTKKSIISRVFRLTSWLMRRKCEHRGFTHTPLCALIITVIVSVISLVLGADLIYSAFFAIGYLTHLLADALTVKGIAFLRPFTQAKFSLLKVKTGGIAEFLISVPLSALLLVFSIT